MTGVKLSTLIVHGWCDWCNTDGSELTHKINEQPMSITARFCSLECASRWYCVADKAKHE